MSTLLLSLIIFGFAFWIIYQQIKGKGHCEECSTNCAVKHEVKKKD